MAGKRPKPTDRDRKTARIGGDAPEHEERHLGGGSEAGTVSAGLVAGGEGGWRESVMKAGMARRRYSPVVRFIIRQLLRPALLAGIAQPEALLFLGTVAQRVGKEALAQRLLLRAVEADPQRAAGNGRLGEPLLVAGRFVEAEAAFRKRLGDDTKETAAQFGLAVALQGQGRLSEAEKTLRYALKDQPEEPALNALLGSVLLATGRHDEALKICKRQIERTPNDAKAHSNLGNVLTMMGQS